MSLNVSFLRVRVTGPQTGVSPGSAPCRRHPARPQRSSTLNGGSFDISHFCDEDDKLSLRADTSFQDSCRSPLSSQWLQFDQLVVSMQQSSALGLHKHLSGHSASAPPLSGTSPGLMATHKPKHWSFQNPVSLQMF